MFLRSAVLVVGFVSASAFAGQVFDPKGILEESDLFLGQRPAFEDAFRFSDTAHQTIEKCTTVNGYQRCDSNNPVYTSILSLDDESVVFSRKDFRDGHSESTLTREDYEFAGGNFLRILLAQFTSGTTSALRFLNDPMALSMEGADISLDNFHTISYPISSPRMNVSAMHVNFRIFWHTEFGTSEYRASAGVSPDVPAIGQTAFRSWILGDERKLERLDSYSAL